MRKPTEDFAAYTEYIWGRSLLEKVTPEALANARQHFENAITRDPGFALAHDAVAELYSYLGYFGYMRPKDAFSIGVSHALAAVETDDTLAEAHALLAEYHSSSTTTGPRPSGRWRGHSGVLLDSGVRGTPESDPRSARRSCGILTTQLTAASASPTERVERPIAVLPG